MSPPARAGSTGVVHARAWRRTRPSARYGANTPRMPCAVFFSDHVHHLTILGHDIMRGNLGLRIGEPVNRGSRIFHTGIMHDKNSHRQLTVVKIGGRSPDHIHVKTPFVGLLSGDNRAQQ